MDWLIFLKLQKLALEITHKIEWKIWKWTEKWTGKWIKKEKKRKKMSWSQKKSLLEGPVQIHGAAVVFGSAWRASQRQLPNMSPTIQKITSKDSGCKVNSPSILNQILKKVDNIKTVNWKIWGKYKNKRFYISLPIRPSKISFLTILKMNSKTCLWKTFSIYEKNNNKRKNIEII